MSADAPPTHGLRFDGSELFVTHRRREYGPFDYQWGADLRSLELTYQGEKYGEVWSASRMCVDLRDHRLPRRVMQVAMLVTGCVLEGLRQRHSAQQRRRLIVAVLSQFGCERFLSGPDWVERPASSQE